MAVTKTVIKNTHNEAVVKVAGTAAGATITLATDILSSNQVVDGATQTVNLVGVHVTGLLGSSITIARNSVNILTAAGENGGYFDFKQQGFVDNIQNTRDIVVTIAGAEAQAYLVLHKVGGYAPTIELASFGAHDDPAVAGS